MIALCVKRAHLCPVGIRNLSGALASEVALNGRSDLVRLRRAMTRAGTEQRSQ
jgi:hypothetical protein